MPTAVIDTHQHLWDLDAGARYPWLASAEQSDTGILGDISSIRHSYLPSNYRADMDGLNVDATVHVQAGWDPTDPVAETDWLSRLADSEGMPSVIVAAATLERDDVDSVLEAHASFHRVRGIRQMLNWHPNPALRACERSDLLSDAAWRRGFARLADYGFSFDLQIFPHQMSEAAALAVSYPSVPLILNHCGLPLGTGGADRRVWKQGLMLLAEHPQVSIKCSGFGIFARDWTAEFAEAMFLDVLAIFGPKRVMVGSDYPVDKLHSRLNPLAVLIDVATGLSLSERDRVLRTNAHEIYRIPPT